MKLGRTIVGVREKTESESERLKLREKKRKKNRFSATLFILVMVFLGVSLYFFVRNSFLNRKEISRKEQNKPTLSVEIIDESGFSRTTERIKEYAGRIEQELKSMGYSVQKFVLPRDKIREIDVYLGGKNGYFKCSLDRNVAETAEDIDRMVKYLERKGIVVQQYVDVRVEKKAFYL